MTSASRCTAFSLAGRSAIAAAASCIGACVLSACADGFKVNFGGDFGPIGPICVNPGDCVPPAEFTSWSAVAPGSAVRLVGSSRQATYTANVPGGVITSVGTPSALRATASLTEKIGADGAVIELTIAPAPPHVGYVPFFAGGGGNIIDAAGIGVLRASHMNGGLTEWGARIADAVELGLNYQSFGVWQTGWHPQAPSGQIGVVTLGAQTTAGAVPTTGTGSYSGATLGLYTASDGTFGYATSVMNATADFAARNIAFSTSQTMVDDASGNPVANASLNLLGTMTFAAGSGQFSGAVATAGGGAGNAAMTGTAEGVFYGPAAQEMGGTFWVTGSGVANYGGAFGGKRP